MLRHASRPATPASVFGTIGALDTALWDIKAKAAGRAAVAAARRPRPGRARLRLGLDIGLTDDELVAVYQAYAERGLRAAKLKGGLDVERDRRRLTLVRDVLTEADARSRARA